jgi:hypothetical protein
MMSDSLVFYWDRADNLNIIGSDVIPHFDSGHPLLNIVVDIINAGYGGVMIDEQRLSDGKYFHALNANLATPEGMIVSELQDSFEAGDEIPTANEVLELINKRYNDLGEIK